MAKEKAEAARPKLRGVPLPDIPEVARQPYSRSFSGEQRDDYSRWVEARTGWAERAIAAGARTGEVAEFLTMHGAPTAPQTISQCRPGGARKPREDDAILPVVRTEIPPPEELANTVSIIIANYMAKATSDMQAENAYLKQRCAKLEQKVAKWAEMVKVFGGDE